MREIKFRAWQKQPSLHCPVGMYVVSDIVWYNKLDNGKTGEVFFRGYGSSEYLEDIDLMQYTGLKDKDGKEIYEGDIMGLNGNPFYRVVWNAKEAMFDFFELGEDSSSIDVFSFYCVNYEVIGNIYENPELLK